MAKQKDAYYFPHYANAFTDPGIMQLRLYMGLEGYALWWVFLEMCRNENTAEKPYSISKPIGFRLLSMYANCDENTAKQFFDVCVGAGLIQCDEDRYFSENFVNTMIEIDHKRAKLKENGRKGGRKPNGFSLVKQNETICLSVKESKVKESKEKKISNTADKPADKNAEEFKQWWNTLAKKTGWLRSVQKLTPARAKKLKARNIDQATREQIEDQILNADEFLRAGSWFGFDWVVKSDENLAKLLEGNYRVKAPEQIEDWVDITEDNPDWWKGEDIDFRDDAKTTDPVRAAAEQAARERFEKIARKPPEGSE